MKNTGKWKNLVFAAALGLVIGVQSVMPVSAMEARGRVCPSCESTNTERITDITEAKFMKEPCIHGYSGQDDVAYRVHYARIYCNSCYTINVTGPTTWEEMSRICQRE